ncbi:MAG: proline--tRNA ligase [Gammaproteobacteria bacterium]|jgi:prolyl-tRNA synthetase|nr:proline--tRNA ligase [Gammaproteobacteria bacterium]MBT5202962.1 proline--tRNA ligase [Gammaproteobacteria bacterium]MBT5600939.1 proline--tRNA ligase [Gammaproteobacteria bacterium]MBT6245908.1 proline--tRNA ligase [Gammaproteobacteria bacterium]
MKVSQYTISTLKEIPADAEIASHQLLIRGGFIRKLASGIYSWLPIGLRVLRKIENIVRQEMNQAGAQELMMPVIQPAELWQESGRWNQYDEGLLLKIKDRHQRDFCFGPTHEEVITEIARNELRSHKQLPVNYYQIQTKFRDETRPRFGVMRAREFLMKDAYSFHSNAASLQQTYQLMHDTYTHILNRIGLNFRAVLADTGSIGGSASMEFHVLADSGEDLIAFSTQGSYAANIELAEAVAIHPADETQLEKEKIATPAQKTIQDIVLFLNADIQKTVKTLIVAGEKQPLVALVIRGDHTLNTLKAEKIPGIASPLKMAEENEIRDAIGCSVGSIGPANLELPVIVDRSAATLRNFICGANEDDYHYSNVNWQTDCGEYDIQDIRNVEQGDACPEGNGRIQIKRGIEVGHIFQLGEKYSIPMNATVLDENGKAQTMHMGCYGMGVSRLVAAAVEQNHDDSGIIWPLSIAPFHVILIPINAHKSVAVAKTTTEIYEALLGAGVEVLLDDRDNQRPGVKFADAELIGIPHRIVIGDRGINNNEVEYTPRNTGVTEPWPINEIEQRLRERLQSAR